MTNNNEQSGISLVFADQDRNYYVIPAEAFERGRVPAECRAEIEEALRAHRDDVSGHGLVGTAVAVGIVGSGMLGGAYGAGMFALGAGGAYAVWKFGEAVSDAVSNSSTPIGDGDTPRVTKDG